MLPIDILQKGFEFQGGCATQDDRIVLRSAFELSYASGTWWKREQGRKKFGLVLKNTGVEPVQSVGQLPYGEATSVEHG